MVTDFSTTTPFLAFAPNTEYPSTTVAGVVQNFTGREQMVFFLAGGSWSSTTLYLGSVWFLWGYEAPLNVTKATTTSSTISATSTISTSQTSSPSATSTPSVPVGLYQTALVIATDSSSAAEAVSILQGYGQPVEFLAMPQNVTALPSLETLNSDGTSVGNYGLIIIMSLCVYNYGGTTGWASAITAQQFNAIYAYQAKYNVRTIYLDSFPGWFSGVALATGPDGCCASDEQYVYMLNSSLVPTAGLRVANMSTIGLWHYPATITNSTTTSAFLEFAANTEYASPSVAGVIQTISGREQMIFFLDGGTWSLTTNYLSHIWFHWGYRGLYNGYRRVAMHQQSLSCTLLVLIVVDDMFLDTDIWNTTTIADLDGQRSRINSSDLTIHMEWVPQFIQSLNPGSVYFLETGFNGNGNMDYVGGLTSVAARNCPDSVDVNDPIGPNVVQEWMKPLGSGVNQWPSKPSYDWSLSCILMDPLAQWFQNATNRDFLAWTSHTFTHEDLENATYYDTNLEMSYNYHHAQVIGLTNATKWSNKTFIPPGISGMHNGDALRALWDNGIIGGVGDSTRPVLCNPDNANWPVFTTVEGNGFAGYTIIPRWASRIYYNVYVRPSYLG